MHMDVYIEVIYIGGWGGGGNREILSLRSCVRAYARCPMPSENAAPASVCRLSLFPFSVDGLSLFPFRDGGLSLFPWVNK